MLFVVVSTCLASGRNCVCFRLRQQGVAVSRQWQHMRRRRMRRRRRGTSLIRLASPLLAGLPHILPFAFRFCFVLCDEMFCYTFCEYCGEVPRNRRRRGHNDRQKHVDFRVVHRVHQWAPRRMHQYIRARDVFDVGLSMPPGLAATAPQHEALGDDAVRRLRAELGLEDDVQVECRHTL